MRKIEVAMGVGRRIALTLLGFGLFAVAGNMVVGILAPERALVYIEVVPAILIAILSFAGGVWALVEGSD